MPKFAQTRRAIAIIAASIVLAGGTAITAGTAQAAGLRCVHLSTDPNPDDACRHQTTLAVDTPYYAGTELWTRDEVLKVQGDGNVVIYCNHGGYSQALNKYINAGTPVWATGTNFPIWQSHPTYFALWHDGNMAHYESDGTIAGQDIWYSNWSSHSWGPLAYAVLQADGNFVDWSHGIGNGGGWSSGTYHVCPGTEYYWNG